MVSKRIPNGTKRIVRREAGYGCCKCGCAIIEYHHLNPKSDKAEDIMALCPSCHDMVTKRAIPPYKQLEYKKNPYNICNGNSKGKLIGNRIKIPFILASHNTIEPFGDMIIVNGECLLGINMNEEGVFDFSLRLYDKRDNLVMEIINNEWISGDYFAWDIEVSYQWIIIRQKARNIILNLDMRDTLELSADLWRNGTNLRIKLIADLWPKESIKNGLIEITNENNDILFSTDSIQGVNFSSGIRFIIDGNGNFGLGF